MSADTSPSYQERIDEIKSATTEGLRMEVARAGSFNSLANRMRVDADWLAEHCKSRGVREPSRGQRNPIREHFRSLPNEALQAELDQHGTFTAMSQHWNVDHSFFSRLYRDRGLSPSKRGVSASGTKVPLPNDVIDEIEGQGLVADDWEVAGFTRGTTGKVSYRFKRREGELYRARAGSAGVSGLDDFSADEDEKLIAFLGDHHAPKIDWELHWATCRALADMVPDTIVLLGDALELAGKVSRHGEDLDNDHTPQDCLNTFYEVASDYRRVCPDARIIMLAGNHDIRINKHRQQMAPALHGMHRVCDGPMGVLDELAWLLRFDELEIEIHGHKLGDYPHAVLPVSDRLVALHGSVAKKGGGASAIAAAQAFDGKGVIQGHTHRLAAAQFSRRSFDSDGEEIMVSFWAVENGCMTDPALHAYSASKDWQQGFTTVSIGRDGTESVDLARWDRQAECLTWRGVRFRPTLGGA